MIDTYIILCWIWEPYRSSVRILTLQINILSQTWVLFLPSTVRPVTRIQNMLKGAQDFSDHGSVSENITIKINSWVNARRNSMLRETLFPDHGKKTKPQMNGLHIGPLSGHQISSHFLSCIQIIKLQMLKLHVTLGPRSLILGIVPNFKAFLVHRWLNTNLDLIVKPKLPMQYHKDLYQNKNRWLRL